MTVPLHAHLGIRFEAVEALGTIRMALEVSAFHLNQAGTLHGGVITSMMDIACAVAIRARVDDVPPGPQEPVAAGSAIVTLTLNTCFVASVRAGTITVVARCRGGGRRIHFAQAELCDAEGRLLATAEGSYTMRASRLVGH